MNNAIIKNTVALNGIGGRRTNITKNLLKNTLLFTLIANLTKVVAEKRAARLKKTILASALSFGMMIASNQSGLCMQQQTSKTSNKDKSKQSIAKNRLQKMAEPLVMVMMPYLQKEEALKLRGVNRTFRYNIFPHALAANTIEGYKMPLANIEVCKINNKNERILYYTNIKSKIDFIARLSTAPPKSDEYEWHEEAFKNNKIQTLDISDTKEEAWDKVYDMIKYINSSSTWAQINASNGVLRDIFFEYFNKQTKIDKGFFMVTILSESLFEYCMKLNEENKKQLKNATLDNYNDYVASKIAFLTRMLMAKPGSDEYKHHETYFEENKIQALDINNNTKEEMWNRMSNMIEYLKTYEEKHEFFNVLSEEKEQFQKFFANLLHEEKIKNLKKNIVLKFLKSSILEDVSFRVILMGNIIDSEYFEKEKSESTNLLEIELDKMFL